jgi:hypothetical protein
MIIRGGWISDAPYINAQVILPNGHDFYTEFQVDTGSSYTFLSEDSVSGQNLASLPCAKTRDVYTVMGPLPAFLIADCSIVLGDDKGAGHTYKLPLYFLREKKLGFLAHRCFKRVLGPKFPNRIKPPRNILGRDILNSFLLLARKPNLLLLTDDVAAFQKDIEARFGSLVDWLDTPLNSPRR